MLTLFLEYVAVSKHILTIMCVVFHVSSATAELRFILDPYVFALHLYLGLGHG